MDKYIHEYQLLSSALINPRILEKVMDLEPEIFLNYNNREIFDLMLRMYHENQSITISTLGLEIKNIKPKLQDSFLIIIKTDTMPEHDIDLIVEKMKDLYEKYTIDCMIIDYKKGKLTAKEFRENVLNIEQNETSEIFDMSELKNMTLDEIFPKKDFFLYPKELQPFNEVLGGIFSSNVTYVTGKPKSGKTTLAMQMVQEKTTLFFSLEMTWNELYAKHLNKKVDIPARRIIMQDLKTYDDKNEYVDLAIAHEKHSGEMRILYSDESRLTRIISLIRKVKDKIDVIVVDNFGLVNAHGYDKQEKMDTISRSFKLISKECKIPIIVLIHLKKEFMKDNIKPTLDAIYNTGAPAKDASEIICLWDKTKINRSGEEERQTIISVLASRFSGTGDIDNLIFDKKRSQFKINQFEKYYGD